MEDQFWDYDAMDESAKKMQMVISEGNTLENTVLEFEQILKQLKWECLSANTYRTTAAHYFSAIRAGDISHQWRNKMISTEEVLLNLIELLLLNKELMQKKEEEIAKNVIRAF